MDCVERKKIMTQSAQNKQRKPAITIKQGALADVMSHLSELPKREKAPDDRIGLPEMFRTKAYAAKIKKALQKGYSFEELAEIFTEKCGVKVIARQLKYHHTHEKNLREKGGKSKNTDVAKDRSSSANPPAARAANENEKDQSIAERTASVVESRSPDYRP